jgi:Protein of unknown function (DUF2384)
MSDSPTPDGLPELFQARLSERRTRLASSFDGEIALLDRRRRKLMETDPEVLLAAIDCLGSYERSARWLTAPEALLGNQSPADAAEAPTGKERVLGLLWRLDGPR